MSDAFAQLPPGQTTATGTGGFELSPGDGRSAEAVDAAVSHAMSIVAELNQQLERAREWAARERSLELNEEQIGKLLAEAEEVAGQTVADARRLAQDIVRQATDEANRLRSGFGLPPIALPVALPGSEFGAGPGGDAEAHLDLDGFGEVRLLRQALIDFAKTNAALERGIATLVDELAARAAKPQQRPPAS